MSQYKDTVVDTVIEFLKKTLPQGYFQQYFYGDPIQIPTSLMPCVVVEKQQTDIIAENTAKDRLVYVINIKLIYNKKNDFGKTSNEVIGVRALEEFAEGRDPVTNKFNPNTIAGILRTGFTLGNLIVDQQLQIDYGVVPRPQDTLTGEAQIRCTLTELVPVIRS